MILLSFAFDVTVILLFSVLWRLPSPLNALPVLWFFLIIGILPAVGFKIDNSGDESLMKAKVTVLDKRMCLRHILLSSILIGGISFIAFIQIPLDYLVLHGMRLNRVTVALVLTIEEYLLKARTYLFIVLGLSQLFHAIGMRNIQKSVFGIHHTSDQFMIAAIVIGILGHLAVANVSCFCNAFGIVPLKVDEWIRLTSLSLIPLLVHSLISYGKWRLEI